MGHGVSFHRLKTGLATLNHDQLGVIVQKEQETTGLQDCGVRKRSSPRDRGADCWGCGSIDGIATRVRRHGNDKVAVGEAAVNQLEILVVEQAPQLF
jgi:hypothetical protein